MDIGGWLRSLGLEKYEAVLRDNEIDEAVLRNLTEDHLRELGFPLGARLKLLNAIAALDAIHPTSATATIAGTQARSSVAAAGTPEAAGERRHITVMFCDLVDSTGIAAKLDAEEWRDLVGAYLDAASAAVTEMGGKVAKKLGDGLMALFGYPVAQENDAERAVRAALSIQRALAELNRKNAGSRKPALAARIAIEIGASGSRCGGGDFRRRAEHRGAGAGAGRAGGGRGYGAGAAPSSWPVCCRGARQP